MNQYFRSLRVATVALSLLFLSLSVQAQDLPSLISVVQIRDGGSDDVTACPTAGSYKLALTFGANLSDAMIAALLDPTIYEIWRFPHPNDPPFTVVGGAWSQDWPNSAPKVIKIDRLKADCCRRNIVYACPVGTALTRIASYTKSDRTPGTYIFQVNLTGKKSSDYEGSARVEIASSAAAPGQTTPSPAFNTASFSPRESDGKDDSDVYVAGELNGAKGSKPAYSADVKLRIPFVPGRPMTRLLFDLMASSSDEADPDSLGVGVELNGYFPIFTKGAEEDDAGKGGSSSQTGRGGNCLVNRGSSSTCGGQGSSDRGRPINRIDWTAYGKIESNLEFENTNLIAGGNLTLPIYIYNGRTTRFTIDPFVGLDLGRNLKSPVEDAENRAIVRPYAGANLFLGLFRTEKHFPLSFEVAFTQRWPLARELQLKKDDDDQLQAIFFSKKPRHFLDMKITYRFTPRFGFFAGYQHGEVPPSYELVNHSFKLGLTYHFRFKKAGEN